MNREELRNKLKYATGKNLDIDLAREALAQLDSSEQAMVAMASYFALEANWKIPLGDGIRAEVKIYGKHTAQHIKVFGILFWQIAEMYVVEELPTGNAAPLATEPGS